MPGSILVVDFDETLTEGDTIGLLINACIDAKAAGDPASPGGGGPEVIKRELQATRDQLVSSYSAAFSQLLAKHLPNEGVNKEMALDMEVATGFLDDVTDFERQRNDVVVESGLLAGVQEKDIEAAASKVKLRPGAAETLQMAIDLGWQVHVMSVNWSAALIRATLGSLPCRIASEGETSSSTEDGIIHIHSNNLEMALGISTGGIARRMQGPLDKGNYLEDILLDNAAMTGQGNRQCVYVGDSIGDLAALLAADFPIILGNNATLRRATTAFGVVLSPLKDRTMEDGPLPMGGMHNAQSWSEVFSFLFPGQKMPHVPARPSPAAQPQPPAFPPETDSAPQPAPQAEAAADASDANPQVVSDSDVVDEEKGLRIQVTSSRAAAAPSAHATPKGAPAAAAASVPRVLAIAGSDSAGGAGIQADLKSILANGAYGVTAISALTAQNSHGVQGVHAVPPEFLKQQIESVLGDFEVQIVKTGMLPNLAAVRTVADSLGPALADAKHHLRALVVDPVMVSTSGHSLAEFDIVSAMKQSLLPLATVLTPNIMEASALLEGRSIVSLQDMRAAAKDLCALGPKAVLLKGGHFNDPAAPGTTVDVLCEGSTITELPVKRLESNNTHGTGCTLASAIAANLAKGLSIEDAVRTAQAYVHLCLQRSVNLPLGSGVQRPMNHCSLYTSWGRQHSPVDYSLYAITDPVMNARHNRSMFDAVQAAIQGGATIIQVREKNCDGGDFVASVRAAIEAARPLGVKVVVNDRVDVALATGADGVHVGQSDIPCAQVRKLVGDTMIVGISTKTVEQAQAAERDGADYIGVGACYPTSTKENPILIGPSMLAEIVATVNIPVVAIGGINAGRVQECVATGCAGIAVVSAVFDQPDVKAATEELADAVKTAFTARSGGTLTAN